MNEPLSGKFIEWRPPGVLESGASEKSPGGYPPAQPGVFRVVAIGNFDGAHRGHAAVVREARALAASEKAMRSEVLAEILALTFDPHPRQFFQPEKPHFQLSSPELRARQLAAIGFDGVVVLPFTAAFAELTPQAFIEEILVRCLGVDGVVVGADFHFGKARAGTPATLVAEGARLGFAVRFVEPLRSEAGAVISSSAIRGALAAGDIPRANAMLGYSYAVRGTVIHGEKRGRELGYPTANLRLDPGNGLKHGIYAVRVVIDSKGHACKSYPGVASFGRRPQFDNGAPLLETHVFDFSGDLYGREIEVSFEAYLRGEAKFASVEALIAQMDADSEEARRLLKSRPR